MIKLISICLSLFFLLFACNGNKKENENKESEQKKEKIESKKKNAGNKKYALSKYFTPVLNTRYFSSVYGGKDGKTLKKSNNGLIKELEYVAYPGTVFEILEEYKNNDHSIYKVYTDEYDIAELNISLYIDSRFTEVTSELPPKRTIKLPDKREIYKYLDRSVGSLYVWGANNLDGVKEMFDFYPVAGSISNKELKEWGLKGVDCSGLIYEATNGYTARNTHQLVYSGEGVEIAGLSNKEIAKTLKPLDIIVWKGHVILVYDETTTIQSSFKAGCVIKKPLLSVLEEISKKRTPKNKWERDGNFFVVRRWFKES